MHDIALTPLEEVYNATETSFVSTRSLSTSSSLFPRGIIIIFQLHDNPQNFYNSKVHRINAAFTVSELSVSDSDLILEFATGSIMPVQDVDDWTGGLFRDVFAQRDLTFR